MIDTEEDNARELALAALLLDAPDAAFGMRPTMEELWDWMFDKVSTERAAEIRSHLARDAGVYEDWRQLRLAHAEAKGLNMPLTEPAADQTENNEPVLSEQSKFSLASRPLNWLRNFFKWWASLPSAKLVGSVAVLCVAVAAGLLQNQPEPKIDFWKGWQVPKSVSKDNSNNNQRIELQAVLSGMHRKMLELTIPPIGPEGQDLPNRPVDCTEDPQCTIRHQRLQELGELAVVSYRACLLNKPADESSQSRAAEILAAIEFDGFSAPLVAPLRQWTNADESATRVRCAAIASLIARALKGL